MAQTVLTLIKPKYDYKKWDSILCTNDDKNYTIRTAGMGNVLDVKLIITLGNDSIDNKQLSPSFQ